MSSWKEFRETGKVGGPSRDRISVLVVDDEQAIVSSLGELFASRFEVYPARSAKQALEIFRQHQPALVLSDQRMPEMTGIELLRQIKDINPDTVCMLVTGYSDINVVVTALNEGLVWKYIAKPWDNRELEQMMRDAVKEYARRTGQPGPAPSFFDS